MLVDEYFVGLAVVGKCDGSGFSRLGFAVLVGDDVEGAAIAVAEGEGRPVGGHVRFDGEDVALFAYAEDVLDAGLVGPGGRTGVPGPAAAARVLRVAVDVGGDAVGLHFVFEYVGQRLGAVHRVDERVEEVGHVVVALFELGHDVPHGAVGVLSSVFAYSGRVGCNVAGVVAAEGAGIAGAREGRCEELDDFVFAVDQTVVGFAQDGLLLFGSGDIGEDAPCLGDKVDLALGVVAAAHGVAVVVEGTEEPGSVPGIVLQSLNEAGAEVGEFAAVGEVGTGHKLCEMLHLGQQVGQEEGHPDTLAFAFDTHAAHAVVPVAATHQRQAMAADTAHGAVDGTAQVLVECGIFETRVLLFG